jgi:hypothetical protein
LTEAAERDQAAFLRLREKLREELEPVCADAGPPAKALGAALLWLILCEPGRRTMVRKAVAECLSDRRAVVQMACGEKRAYVTSVGVNPRDMRPILEAAEKSPKPLTVMYRSKPGPRTIN